MTVPFVLRRPGLRRSLLASIAGNTGYALGSWLVLATLAKVTDGAAVGRYVLALALTAPIFLLANLQLREVQATDHAGELPFATYLRARLATSGLALMACAPLALLYDGPTRFVILLAAAAKSLDAVVDIYYGDWLRQERQSLVAWSMFLRGSTTVGLIGGALLLTRSLAVACVVSVAQSGLGLAHAAWVASGKGSPWSEARAEGGALGEGVVASTGQLSASDPLSPSTLDAASRRPSAEPPVPRRGKGYPLSLLPFLPLGLAVALDSLTVNVPRYLIQSHLGLAKVGAFGAVCTFMQLGTATVVVGLTQVGLPRLSRLYAAGDREGYSRLLLRLLGIGAGLGALGIGISVVHGKEILGLAFGPAYGVYDGVLRVTMLAAVAWYASGILACGVTAMREFRVQLPVFGAATSITGLACLALIPRYGLEGAAAAIGLGFLFRALANGALVLRRL